MTIRKYEENDIDGMIAIWNEIVDAGDAFPQEEPLTHDTGKEFFAAQTYTGVAVDEGGKVVGLYILHPNNVGRCGHICNASYAVSSKCRGRHIGEKLVLDCLGQAKTHGSASSSSTPWLKATSTRGIFTSGLASHSSVPFRTASA